VLILFVVRPLAELPLNRKRFLCNTFFDDTKKVWKKKQYSFVSWQKEQTNKQKEESCNSASTHNFLMSCLQHLISSSFLILPYYRTSGAQPSLPTKLPSLFTRKSTFINKASFHIHKAGCNYKQSFLLYP